jgi:hypothetical protein
MREPRLWAIIGAATLLRLVIAVATTGLPYDVQSWYVVRHAFSAAPGHVYSVANAGGIYHWPYPPGFFPLMLAASGVADLAGGGFIHLVKVPSILADAALTWLVWEGLRDRASERARLLAAALVAFGPVFIVISGYSAQIDPVAILPAVGALLVWERAPQQRRAWIAGLLIGLAAAAKTVPLAMVIALAPTARDRRELATLIACAVAVPLVAIAPFALIDYSGVRLISHYQGSPGMGGIGLILQPDLAARWLSYWVVATRPVQWLFIDHAGTYNAVVLLGYAALAWWLRPSPRIGAAMLWLIVFAFGSGFFFQYLVWGLPFFLLAGYLRATALLELVVTVPMLIYFLGPWKAHSIVALYVPFMIVVWAGWAWGAVVLARQAAASRRSAVQAAATT